MVLALSRTFCSYKRKLILECLHNRGLLKIEGSGIDSFMQGLITNDFRHLTDGAASMYTMFLNTKGRVLFDSIIYKTNNPEMFYLECDKDCISNLEKHLKMYRIRRKIEMTTLDNFKLWVVFDAKSVNNLINPLLDPSPKDLSVPCSLVSNTSPQTELVETPNGLLVYRDPRMSALGLRILAKPMCTFQAIAKDLGMEFNKATENDNYKVFRYTLGIGEGASDLPPGKCFPLESNCDYLHGVSFHKGCYIGQELTARTHHTGVVRKRLMPITLDTKPTIAITDEPITSSPWSKTTVGKLRGIEGTTGLALLRITQALEADYLKLNDIKGKSIRPVWWPIEAPKIITKINNLE